MPWLDPASKNVEEREPGRQAVASGWSAAPRSGSQVLDTDAVLLALRLGAGIQSAGIAPTCTEH
jgi:hypothetical protein